MYKYIDEERFSKIIKEKDWYFKLEPELTKYFWDYENQEKDEKYIKTRIEIVKLFSEKLVDGSVFLGDDGEDLDADRKNIDTVVIHHSNASPDLPLRVFDAFGLIRVYTPVYSDKSNSLYGLPIRSGHFFNGRQTFIAYHYIIHKDGSFEKTLKDSNIGWHCGNWDYNCRSVAVCFHDDLTDTKPTSEAINTCKQILSKYKDCRVLGHREILTSRTCPGNKFLGQDGWKNELFS